MTREQIEDLLAIDHTHGCKWHDDDGWNSGTFPKYVSFGEYPECMCRARRDVRDVPGTSRRS